MQAEHENKNFDITRRNEGVLYKHYQLMVKLMHNEKTEHHNVEVFTTGPQQLLEMRRIYVNIQQHISYKTFYNVARNN